MSNQQLRLLCSVLSNFLAFRSCGSGLRRSTKGAQPLPALLRLVIKDVPDGVWAAFPESLAAT